MNDTFILCTVIAFAGFFQGITGFGSMLIAIPVLSLFMDIRAAIPVLMLFGFVINTTITVSLWRHIRWKRTLLLLGGTLPGIPLGVWMLEHGEISWLQLTIAAVLLAFSMYGLVFKGFKNPPGRVWAPIAGFGCGFLTAAISAGGPPVIVYATSQHWPKDEIKALMAAYFMIAANTVIVVYVIKGIITDAALIPAAIGSPLLLLAIHLGQKLYNRLSGNDYRKLVLLVLLGLGLMMLYRALS